MNIIDTEDMIKGLPDAALQKEAQNPSGQAPQFLVVSEIKRRKDMRARYAQNQPSQGTVKDQLLGMNTPAPQQQMASMGQPQGRPMPPMGGQMLRPQQPAPQMGMYGGGVVRMAEGLTTPNPYLEGRKATFPMSEVPPQTSIIGQRINNPYNIRQANQGFVGESGEEGGFVSFDDPMYGVRAADRVLSTYDRDYGINSIRGLLNRYAPPEDDNDTESYISYVSNKLGVDPDAEIDLSNPEVRSQVLSPIAMFESRSEYSPGQITEMIASANEKQGAGPLPGFGGLPNEDIAPAAAPTAAAPPVVPKERIRGLQFPTGLSGVDSSSSGPQGNDQARMIAAQAARLREAQSIGERQGQAVQPPPRETIEKLREENRNPNQMSLREVRNIPGFENMEMGEQRTVNQTLNIYPGTPPEVRERANALFMNNKPLEAQALADRYKPEPKPKPVGIEQLVAAGMSNVGGGMQQAIDDGSFAGMSEEQREAIRKRVASRETSAISPEARLYRERQGTPEFSKMNEIIEGLNSARGANPPILPFIPRGTKSQIQSRSMENPVLASINQANEPDNSSIRYQEMLDQLEGSGLDLNAGLPSILETAEKQQSLLTNPSGAVEADSNRVDLTKLDDDTISAAVAGKVNPNGTASRVVVGSNSASDQGDNDRQGSTSTDKSVQGRLDDITDRTEGEESSEYKIPSSLEALRGEQQRLAQGRIKSAEELRLKEESYKDLLDNRQRPTLSYADLIRESEQSMTTQLADIKNEKGSQALIALGAGIASGDLAKGLSDAGKAVAKTNAQKRALEARQQAVRMGFRKSEVDAVYQNQIAKEGDKLKSMKFDIDSLRKLNVSTEAAEQSVLTFDAGLEKTIATLEQSREFKLMDKAKQDSLNRRAALDFVTDSMREMQLINKSEEEIARIQNVLLNRAASALNIDVKAFSAAGATGTATSGTTKSVDFNSL